MMGHSMGGLIVLDYALHYPEGLRGVIAVAPSVGELGVSAWKMGLGQFPSRVWPWFAMNAGLDSLGGSRDPEVVRAAEADDLCQGQGTNRLAAEVNLTIDRTLNNAVELRVPLLILPLDLTDISSVMQTIQCMMAD